MVTGTLAGSPAPRIRIMLHQASNPSPSLQQQRFCPKDQDAAKNREDVCAAAASIRQGCTFQIRYSEYVQFFNKGNPYVICEFSLFSLIILQNIARSSFRYLFRHAEGGALYRHEVELHLQVRSSGAALHVEHFKIVCRVVLESISFKILVHTAVIPGLIVREPACVPEHLPDRRAGAVRDSYGTCREINPSLEGVVNTADIQDKHVIDINPQVGVI